MFYVTRHAESKAPQVWGEDVGLTNHGKFQATHYLYGLPWRDIQNVFTSNSISCIQTGLLAAKKSKAKLVPTGLLDNQKVGDLAGKPFTRYRSEGYYDKLGGSEGESLLDVAYRWRAFVDSFKPTSSSLVITHNCVLQAALLKDSLDVLNWPVALEFKHCKPFIY